MLWCQGAQDIGLSNRKLKSARYDYNLRLSQIDGQMDRRTDEHHDNSATIRSTDASSVKSTRIFSQIFVYVVSIVKLTVLRPKYGK